MSKSNRRKNIPVDQNRPQEPAATVAEHRERQELAEEKNITDLLSSELAQGGSVVLFRRGTTGPTYSWINRIAVDQFSMEVIAATYGGGDYQAQVYSSTKKHIKTYTFTIDHSIPAKHPLQKPLERDSDAVGLAKILNEKKDGQSDMTTMLMAMLEDSRRREEAAQRRFETLMASRMGGGGGSNERLMEILLEKHFDQKPTPLRELLEFNRTIEAMKNGEDPDPEEDSTPMGKLLKGIGTVLAPAIERAVKTHLGGGQDPRAITGGPGAAGSAGPGPGQDQAGPRRPGPPRRVVTVTEETPANQDKAMITQFRTMALQAAKSGKDPLEWITSMFQMVPESAYENIFAVANSPDWQTKIFGAETPELLQYAEFLSDVRNETLVIAMQVYSRAAVAQGSVTPEEWAKKYAAWITPDFRPDARDLAENPKEFAEVFEQEYSATDAKGKDWLEKFRVALLEQIPAEAGPN